MSDVSISIEARDRVSQTLDAITRSVDSLNKALDEMDTKKGPEALTEKLRGAGLTMSSIGKGMQTVGGKMTKYITKPAVGAATALGGLTIAKGFSRMQQIDEARAKIKAMGQDFDSIKQAALDATKGTAFALNDALTAGASAAAAGVTKGDMPKYMQAVADTAAVAGTSFNEMGMVFNKVMANGKMSAEEWNMMTDRGVDVFGALRKATGKTNEELLEMRQNGEITSDVFLDAFANAYEKVDGKTLAQQIGESTISGAVSNINAALGRIGANFLGDTEDASTFAGKLLPLLTSIKDALGKVEDGAEKIGKKFGDLAGPYMEKMTNFFNGIADGSVKIDGAKAKMAGIAAIATTALGPALTIAGKAMVFFSQHGAQISTIAGAFKKMGPSILRIGGPIALIATGIMAAWQNSEAFRKAATNLFSTLWSSLQTVATAIAPIFQSLISIIGPVMGAIGDLLAPLVTVLATVIADVAQKVAAVAAVVAPVMATIAGAVGKAAAKIQELGGAWKAIKSGTKSLLTTVSHGAKAVLDAIKAAWDAIKSAVKNLTVSVLGGAAGILGGIKSAWDAIKSGTKTLTTHIQTIRSGGGGKGGSGGGKHHATGTKSAEGGWTLVGERGPEMVDLPKGASVHTARETERLMASSVTVNMTNNLAQEGKSVEQIINELTMRLQAAASASAEGTI